MKFVRTWMAFLLSCGVLTGSARAEEQTITVNAPNPLEWVAWVFGCRYGVAISYEGPEFEHPDDLVDVVRMSTPTPEALTNCAPSSDIVSRYCYFTARFTVDEVTGEPTNILTTLREIVADYNKGDNPGKFTVVETVAGPCIVATSVKSRTGEWKEVQPLLSRPISVSISNVTNLRALEAVLRAVQALTDVRIVPVTLTEPMGGITLHAENEPARDVLARLLTHPEYGGISNRWYFFYSACPPGYGFQDMPTEKGYVPSPLPARPWSMVGNVTHPNYRTWLESHAE